MTTTATATTTATKREKRAAVSFTGGKDCHLAMERCKQSGNYEIVCLVLFHPKDPKFRAHPIEWQHVQADAMNLPLATYCVEAVGGCYQNGYARAIRALCRDHSIDTIIAGDIDYVGSMTTNFMTEVCETHVPEVTIELPLWHNDRQTLLMEMLDRTFHIIFSCVKHPLDESWIGRRLDQSAICDLHKLDVDLTGENGEYHTMVLNTPSYNAGPLKLVQHHQEEQGKGLALELKDQLGQKERWWVCSPDTKLEKDG